MSFNKSDNVMMNEEHNIQPLNKFSIWFILDIRIN